MSQDPRWTDDTEAAATKAMLAHTDHIEAGETGAHIRCSCGARSGPATGADLLENMTAHRQHRVHAILTALADNGLLVPPGGKMPWPRTDAGDPATVYPEATETGPQSTHTAGQPSSHISP
jgi:hypothetical protein